MDCAAEIEKPSYWSEENRGIWLALAQGDPEIANVYDYWIDRMDMGPAQSPSCIVDDWVCKVIDF